MSRILRRPMFRGGRVDARGTGIASGLGYNNGGRVGLDGGGFLGSDGKPFTYTTNSPGRPPINNPVYNSKPNFRISGYPNRAYLPSIGGARGELSALYNLLGKGARGIGFNTATGAALSPLAAVGGLAYLNRAKTDEGLKVMKEEPSGTFDETAMEGEMEDYYNRLNQANTEGEEISFLDNFFLNPETDTYPKWMGRASDKAKRAAIEKAKKIAEEGGDPDKELSETEKTILALEKEKEDLIKSLEDALKPKESKELTEDEKLAKIEKNKAMIQKAYGSGVADDASAMLLNFAGKALKPEATVKSAFGEFFEAEGKRPSERKKYKDAATTAAINAFLTGEKTMAEVEAYMSKAEAGERIKYNIAQEMSDARSWATRVSESGKKNYTSPRKMYIGELPDYLNDIKQPYNAIEFTEEKKVKLEGDDGQENVGKVFVDLETGVFFIVEITDGKIQKKYLNK